MLVPSVSLSGWVGVSAGRWVNIGSLMVLRSTRRAGLLVIKSGSLLGTLLGTLLVVVDIAGYSLLGSVGKLVGSVGKLVVS